MIMLIWTLTQFGWVIRTINRGIIHLLIITKILYKINLIYEWYRNKIFLFNVNHCRMKKLNLIFLKMKTFISYLGVYRLFINIIHFLVEYNKLHKNLLLH